MSVEALKKALKDKTFTLGTDETIKKIKLGKVSTIFLAKDCNSSVREKILNYKKKSKLDVVELDINSAEIGALCKKQFSISVLSY